jgi:subtilisin family serine protease
VTEQGDWRRGMTARIIDEVEYIVEAFENREEPVRIGVMRKGRGLDYMYAEGQLLVLEQYIDDVVTIVEWYIARQSQGGPDDGTQRQGQATDDEATGLSGDKTPRPVIPGGQRVLPGLILYPIPLDISVPGVLAVIDEMLGEGRATPNHVLTVSGNGNGYNPDETAGPCAATDPEAVDEGTEPYPGVCHCNSAAGVRVYIADTGLIPDAGARIDGTEVILAGAPDHPWLAGVRGKEDPQTPPTARGPLKPYAGHGTFVAGVLRCVAPAADIYVGNVFCTGGSALETDFVADLYEALHRGTDIFHLSCASTTRKDLALLSFWTWLEQLRKHQGIACAAPSGNSGSRRPHWPAASPEVASVGALAADWRSRASFSNYGGWVDAYAPGRNLINAYGTGYFKPAMFPYSPERPEQEEEQAKKYGPRQQGHDRYFYGMARWSGTSFSSPIVTGLIADRMWRTGEDGIEAAAAVLRTARCHAIPGVGAIALPCGEDRGCRCAEGRDCRCGKDRDCRCGGTPLRPRL